MTDVWIFLLLYCIVTVLVYVIAIVIMWGLYHE